MENAVAKNKSNYSAVQHQKPCLQRGLQNNRAKKQTQGDSRCVFGDRTERHTNSNFLFSYTAIFTLIINHLTIERVGFFFYVKHHKM